MKPFVVLLLISAAIPAGAEKRGPPCVLPADSYLVLESKLEYFDVSGSYARSIYEDVRQIVGGYLAASPDCPFYADEKSADLAGHDRSTLLNLFCEVRRIASEVRLSVRIIENDSWKVRLSLAATVPFLEPTALLSSFANDFEGAFDGKVARSSVYAPPAPGFQLGGGVMYPGLFLGNVGYGSMTDLRRDLQSAGGVPEEVRRAISIFEIRRTLESTVIVTAALVGLVCLVPIAFVAEYMKENPGSSVELPPALYITAGVSILVTLTGVIEMAVFPPRGLIVKLNDWAASAERTPPAGP